MVWPDSLARSGVGNYGSWSLALAQHGIMGGVAHLAPKLRGSPDRLAGAYRHRVSGRRDGAGFGLPSTCRYGRRHSFYEF